MDPIISFLAGVAIVYIPVQISSLLSDERLISQTSRLIKLTISLLATCALLAALALALTSWTFLIGIVVAIAFIIFALPALKPQEPEADIVVGDDDAVLLGESLGRESQSRLALAISDIQRDEPVADDGDRSGASSSARSEAIRLLARGVDRDDVEILIAQKHPGSNAREVVSEAEAILGE